MKVIIDTDCGTDDAVAILLALKIYDVVGITCVSGNTYIDNVCKNVGAVLELAGKKVPFYKGCSDFILSQWTESTFLGHGSDGLGDVGLTTSLIPEKIPAVDALIELTKKYENDVHIIAIGPLTNIALATLIDPDLPKRVKSFTIMGGAHQCKGNIGFASEFNIDCDPEAAHICLTKFPMTRMITWETCYKCHLSWDWFDKLGDTKYGEFIKKINSKNVEIYREDDPGLIICDLVAMSSFVTEKSASDMHCRVELHGSLTRGATVFNWGYDSIKPNVRLIKIDMEKFITLVEDLVKS